MMLTFIGFMVVYVGLFLLLIYILNRFEDVIKEKMRKNTNTDANAESSKLAIRMLKSWMCFEDKAYHKGYDFKIVKSPFPADKGKSIFIVSLWKDNEKVKENILELNQWTDLSYFYTFFEEVFTREEKSNEDNK